MLSWIALMFFFGLNDSNPTETVDIEFTVEEISAALNGGGSFLDFSDQPVVVTAKTRRVIKMPPLVIRVKLAELK